MRRAWASLAAMVAATSLLAACGGSDSKDTSAAAPAASSTEAAATAAASSEAASTEAASTEAASTEAASSEAASTEAVATEIPSTEAVTTGEPAESSVASSIAPECLAGQVATKKDGVLTIGTDKPGYPPYIVDDDPTNGQGFESAVAYAVAARLGFGKDAVKWKVVPFNSSYKPGDKGFDFDINQISITDARKKAVDFSQPYYTAPQAVVTTEGSKIAGATSIAELSGAKLGAQIGTTSLDASKDILGVGPQVFDGTDAATAALKNKQIDGIVADLPTAIYLANAVLDKGKVLGQFQAPGGDQWGLLVQKGSSLTPCLDQALTAMQADGELDQITQQWMGADTAPELK